MFRKDGRPGDGKGTGAEQGDSPGTYVKDHDVPALQARRYLWTARMFCFFAMVSILANIAQSMALYALAPLKEVRPYLVTLAKKSDVVSVIEPLQRSVRGFDIMAEALVREYVVLRNAIVNSNLEMERRWVPGGKLQLMSSEEEYRSFATNVIPTFGELRRAGVTREVEILSVNILSPLRLYQVEFIRTERDKEEKPLQAKTYEATIEIGFEEKKVRDDQKFVNPTGFTVVNYTIAEKKGS